MDKRHDFNNWNSRSNILGLDKTFYDYMRIFNTSGLENIEVDHTYNNEKFLSEQFKDLLKISDEDMRDKDKDWLKGKIRQFKIDVMCNGK